MLKIGVLMGGKSPEHEVCFNSGRTVCDHLDIARYEIIPLYQTRDNRLFILPWPFLHRGKTADFEHRLSSQGTRIYWSDLKRLVDFVFIAMHGRFAEDGTLQGVLEILQIPYLGSKVFASALSMDKVMQKRVLSGHGVATARGIIIEPYQLPDLDLDFVLTQMKENKINFPVVVKPYKEGSSLGTSVVHEKTKLLEAIYEASSVNPALIQDVLVEEKIEGMEFSCIVITDYKNNTLVPLAPTEVVADPSCGFVSYEQKYMPGRAIQFTPARCTDAQISLIQHEAVRVMEILGMENTARIDGFLTRDNRVVIIDPNSLSGMAPASYLFKQAAEHSMGHTALINHLIETELQRYNMLQPMIDNEQTNKAGNRLKIAVLLGGASAEKEISLESGRNVIYKLSPQKYEAVPIFIDDKMQLFKINEKLLVSSSTQELQKQLTQTMQINWDDLPQLVDFVFIGLHGGLGENGCVQGMLEMLGLPYNGSSVLTSALCMDKFKTTSFLRAEGFEIPSGMLIKKDDWLQNEESVIKKILSQLNFPIILKPHDDGCSVLVSKISSVDELQNKLTELFTTRTHALVEECIVGFELTVGVLGNHHPFALPPSQAMVNNGILSIEEKFLPGAGENQTPALLPQDTLILVQETIANAYKALRCKGYARIDCFYQNKDQSPTGKERVVIIEVNTLPGLTPATCIFHQAAEIGLKPMEFIDKIIQLGLEEHKNLSFQLERKENKLAHFENLFHTKPPLQEENL